VVDRFQEVGSIILKADGAQLLAEPVVRKPDGIITG
jgi:hypothetical protein